MHLRRTPLFLFILSILSLTTFAQAPARPPANFKSQITEANGVKIHYVIGGKGEPLVLLHGFGNNWYMWNRLLPELSKHFTVIAPDLPGVGESGKPASGYDKMTLAADIHALVKKLGYTKINLTGHDIGFMVAFAYAAQFSTEVKRLALMDALIPGVEPAWSEYWAKAWWWGFFGWPKSGELVSGKEKLFLTNFWPTVGYVKDAFTGAEVNEFVRAYATPGGTTGSFHWFGAFPQDAKDNLTWLKSHKLQMPVLAVGGDHSTGSFLTDHVGRAAVNVKGVLIKGSGHWLAQEQTAQLQAALLDFFLAK